MREPIDITYGGLLGRLSQGGYLTLEEQARVARILSESSGRVSAFCTHELLRRMISDGRLSLYEGNPTDPAAAITAADPPRGVLFVLPPLGLEEPGMLRAPLDPALGPPPFLSPQECARLFHSIGRMVFPSIEAASDPKTVLSGVLDLLREFLDVPAALASGRALALPGGIARGAREAIFGGRPPAEFEREEPESPDALPDLPQEWRSWILRAAAAGDESAIYLFDFRALARPLARSPGSALLLPLASPDPAWDAVLVAVAERPAWFDGERLARARLIRAHARRLLDHAIRLQAAVSIDYLTGINNRSYFVDQFTRALAAAARRSEGFGLLIVDIDDFRQFNSRHGYDAGDAVLQAIAQALQRALRATDVIARYGGEEFAAILPPPVTLSEAMHIGERLRQAVEGLPVTVPTLTGSRQRVPVSVSIGGALFPDDGRGRDELWNAANRMLLAAKADGKNRVRFPERPDQSARADAPKAPDHEGPPPFRTQ